MNDYQKFIDAKSQLSGNFGFKPTFIPDKLFEFQKSLLTWAVEKGKAAIFADTGLGKSAMQLAWSQNIVEKTNSPVLLLTPIAVGPQTVKEGQKFGIEAKQSRDGKINSKIVITNYQQLSKFDWKDFGGVAGDESSILKNLDGKIKAQVTEFMRKIKYRSLWTATAAPNDYIELGTHSEALGELGYMDMLGRFFKNAQNSLHPSVYRHRGMDFNRLNESAKWRFRGHAEQDFWRWVCSWARAVRKPSDLGFDDDGYILPKLTTIEHTVKANSISDGYLFELPAVGLAEQRSERRRTMQERCALAASLVNDTGQPAICWCHLNQEGNLLEKLIPDAVEIDGNDSDEFKEETIINFVNGKIRVIVSKGVILGFGLNLQNCNHQTFFPSHSFEQWYQCIRRSWRFGQKRPVRIDMITSEGERGVLNNLNRKAEAAERMFTKLVELINNELKIEAKTNSSKNAEMPNWL
jgi:hypothetical protein